MAQLARTWLGLCALGAGLIHLAVAASSPPALLALFVLIGAAEVAWGVAALARPRLPLPRIATAGALLPVAIWFVTLLSTPMPMPMPASSTMSMAPVLPAGAMLGAGLFDLLIVSGIALEGRAGEPRSAHSPWRFVLGVLVGAAVVAVVTANSLAATPTGGTTMPGMSH